MPNAMGGDTDDEMEDDELDIVPNAAPAVQTAVAEPPACAVGAGEASDDDDDDDGDLLRGGCTARSAHVRATWPR